MEEQGKQQEIEIEEVTAQENVIAVRDLVPMRAAMDDSMERIADMKDQFSQTIDPILRMYNAAMCATTARLEIIEDEFKYRKLRCPIHHIDTRLKSAKSILGKLQKKDLDLTLSAACNNIYDIAGIRVVCSYIKDVYLIRDRLMAQDDVMIMQIKDYIETPKENGYRSLHMVIRVPVYFMNKKQTPTSLQPVWIHPVFLPVPLGSNLYSYELIVVFVKKSFHITSTIIVLYLKHLLHKPIIAILLLLLYISFLSLLKKLDFFSKWSSAKRDSCLIFRIRWNHNILWFHKHLIPCCLQLFHAGIYILGCKGKMPRRSSDLGQNAG